jgi:hypothetical protein
MLIQITNMNTINTFRTISNNNIIRVKRLFIGRLTLLYKLSGLSGIERCTANRQPANCQPNKRA